MEIVIIMRKKFVPVIIFILCMQVFSLNFVFGDTVVEQVKDTTQTDNVLIKNVLRPLSIEQYEVKIFDEDNNDVTENWKSKLHQLVYKGSPHDIETVIQKNHLNIYATEKIITLYGQQGDSTTQNLLKTKEVPMVTPLIGR